MISSLCRKNNADVRKAAAHNEETARATEAARAAEAAHAAEVEMRAQAAREAEAVRAAEAAQAEAARNAEADFSAAQKKLQIRATQMKVDSKALVSDHVVGYMTDDLNLEALRQETNPSLFANMLYGGVQQVRNCPTV